VSATLTALARVACLLLSVSWELHTGAVTMPQSQECCHGLAPSWVNETKGMFRLVLVEVNVNNNGSLFQLL